MSELLFDRAGRRRSPATMPGFHAGADGSSESGSRTVWGQRRRAVINQARESSVTP